MVAKLHGIEARGFALLGDTRETRQAVAAAQRSYESVTSEDAVAFYSSNGFGGDLGIALRGIGDVQQAMTMETLALDGVEPWKVRPLCVVQIDLALTHLAGRDLEQAAMVGRDALRTAAALDSTIILERLRSLHRHARPLVASSSQLRDLDEQLTDHLRRTIRSA